MPYLSEEEITGGVLNQYQTKAAGEISRRPAWLLPEMQADEIDPERTLGGTLKDVGVSIGKGALGTGQAAIGLADIVTPGQLGKGLESVGIDLGAAQEYLSEQYTPAQKAAFREVEEAKGFLPTLGAMVTHPSTIGHAIVESAPAIAAGGLIGRGALALAPRIGGLTAGAIGEGAITAGQTAEGIREQAETGEITGKQSLMALGAGAGTGALGLLGGRIAQKLGIGDIDTMLASGQFAEKSNKGVIRRILEGGISEGVFEEMPQSIQEQVWMNAATGKDLTEGIGEAGAAGLLTGAAMGGGVNVFTSPQVRTDAGIKDQTDWNQYFQDYELQELNNEYQNIQAAKQVATTPEEQAIVKQRQDQVINQLHTRKEAVDAQQGVIKSPEEIQRDRDQRQFEYEQLFGLPAGVKSAQESAEIFGEVSPEVKAARERQQQIEQTYLPAEEEAARIQDYRLQEAQQIEEAQRLRQQQELEAQQAQRISERRKSLFGPTAELSEQEYRKMVQEDTQREQAKQQRIRELKNLRENERYQTLLREEIKEIFPENSDLVMQRLLKEDYESPLAPPRAIKPTEQELDTARKLQAFEERTGKKLPRVEFLLDLKLQDKLEPQIIEGKPEGQIQVAGRYPTELPAYDPQAKTRAALGGYATSRKEFGKVRPQYDSKTEKALQRFTMRPERRLPAKGTLLDVETAEKTIPILDPASGEIISLTDRGLPIEPKPYDPFEGLTQRLGGKVFPRPQDISPEAVERQRAQVEPSPVVAQPEQPVEEVVAGDEVGPVVEKPIVDQKTIREDFQAREDLISEMESELEANQLEQDRLGVNDPMREELEFNATELRTQIQDAKRELLVDRISAGPENQFQVVYHGTPHEWQPEVGFPYGRPRLDYIFDRTFSGAGQAQTGVGFYMTTSKETGNRYKDSFTKSPQTSLYTLDIQDKTIPKLMLWDKVFIDQPDYVKQKFQKDPLINKFLTTQKTGEDIYYDLSEELNSPIKASKYLASIGIPGNSSVDVFIDENDNIIESGDIYVIWDQNTLDQISLLKRNKENLEKIQAEIRSEQEPGQGIALPEIQKMYKDQEVFQGDDGTISVRFKNGKGATIQNIQNAGNGFIRYAIDTGQMSKEGKILGVTTGTNILLDSEFADNATLWHENKHVLDNLGMITEKDNSLLNKEFNKLRKANKLNFGLSTHEDPRQAMVENRANTFAQIMVERENYRGTTLGKVIQKIMDFFNGLLGIGRQTLGGFVREVEKGKIYERPTNQIEQELSQKSFSTITDQELIQKLDSVPTTKFYRAMQLIDGNLYPPMSAKVEGKLREPTELGVWEIADEKPELADDKGMFKLDKANKSAIKARYNPYFHSSPSPLNDQFSSAYARPNLVTVEIEVPTSELEGTYKAEKAKDSVGLKNWHAGPVSSKLPKGKKRTVMLSRYAKMNRIVPDSEVAQTIANLLEGENLSIPDHVVTPSLREELQKLGVPITRSKQVQKAIDKGQFEEYDINKITPQFQVADLTKPEQKISDNVYRDIYEQQSSLVEKLNQNIKKTGREINRGMNKYLGMISTNLRKINPMLEAKVRKLGFDTTKAIKKDLETAKPLLDKLKDMSPQDKSDWHWARVNGDAGRIRQITDKYGMTETYRNVRETLNRIRRDGEAVGYNIGFIDEYWPRILKDRTGFLQATQKLANEPVFSRALKAQADKLGTTVDALDDGLKADIISNIILGRPSGIGGPVNIRQRYFAEVPPEYAKFYMDSDAALMSYIYAMNKKIEARKFFGKVPERIAGIKKDKRTKETRLANLTQLESDLVADGQDTTEVKKQLESLRGDIQIAQNELDKYGSQDDFKENIGSYVMDLMVKEKLNPGTGVKANDEQALKDILTARFNEKGTTGLANVYKNLAYIDTMGSPISAITQIGDLAWAVYVGGLTPRGIANSVKNIGKAIVGKSDITREDIGITRIAQEFADGDTLSNAVSKIFKVVGIEKLDRIGKEALINNSFDNYRRKAESAARDTKEMERFKTELRPMFGAKSEKVINDLLDPNVASQSEDVKLLVYSRLLDFQPADLSETPEAYLNAGNGRLFYMLKMFTLKQFDVFRREVWHNIKTGERDKVLQGLGNMTKLLAVLSLANAGADELKDLVLGKDTKFEDHVIENLLTLGGASRYLRMQTTREGIGSGLAGQILPPFKFIDAISKDVMTDTRDGLRSVDSIPVGGKLYYWHYGRGKDKRESIEEKDFNKETKEFRKFKKDFDNSEDKRLFLRSNLGQFKQMKFYDNMSKAIRGNKATIDKLKDIKQTPNVRRRLSQLEQQRKDLIKRYFERKERL